MSKTRLNAGFCDVCVLVSINFFTEILTKVNEMCNLSAGIYEAGYYDVTEKGWLKIIHRIYKKVDVT